MHPSSFLVLATLVASASAHGWISTVKVASSNKVFKGNKPTEETPKGSASAIRQISNNSPVKDLSSSDLTCGRDALKASEVITVPAGSKLDITWQTATADGLWLHDVGPMLTYMAKCDGSCADFDASKAKFFKIQEQAKDSTGKWYQEQLDEGSPASVTIPSNLKAGNYLLRHEIIALHTAMTEGNAEFYPGCVQLTVTGSGSGAPSSGETVSLPGAYKSTDAGILIDVYNMKGDYKFPGPKVASFVSGSSSSAPANGGDDDAGDDDEETKPTTTTSKKASSPAKTSSTKGTKATSSSVKDASPTTTAQSLAPTSGSGSSSGSNSPSCKAKRDRRAKRAALAAAREAEPVIDITKKVRRSRVRNLHRAGGAARSF